MTQLITTLTVLGMMIGIAIPLGNALSKNTAATTKLSDAVEFLSKSFEDYKYMSGEKFRDINNDLDCHEEYLQDHEIRLTKLEK